MYVPRHGDLLVPYTRARMTRPRLVLRCMNGSGGSSSPGRTVDCHIASGEHLKAATHVIYANGDVRFQQVQVENDISEDTNKSEILAEIRKYSRPSATQERD